MSGRGAGLPGAPSQIPGLPENFREIKVEGFSGLNAKQARPAIKDSELSICDGWMPIAPNMLQVLPGTGPIFYTSGTPGDIVWMGFGNIGSTLYLFALHSNGSLTATYNGAENFIMPPGTITNPRSIFGFSQWGSLYALFCCDQVNGYWLWDGTSLFGAGTAGPTVDISDGGVGYTSAPGVSVIGGSGSGIVLTAQIDNGAVSLVTVNSPGSGYELGDTLIVQFAGGNGTTTPVGTATIADGVITSTFLQSGGSGYQSGTGVQTPPTVVITDATGSGATIIVNGMSGGIITSLQIVAGGSLYTAPTLSFTGGSGGGAAALAFVDQGVITGVTMATPGTGLTVTPTVQFVGPTGAGAVGLATIDPSTGGVSQVQMQAGGKGYTNTTYAIFSGGNGPAVGTLGLMPFGVSGTDLEIYQGHVWVGNGAAVASFPPKGRVIYSAGGDPSDFGDDGGAFVNTNSFARIGYQSLHQTNGFLYLIADSSLDYISGVTQSSTATTATTTFNDQNADPQIGSPWPSSSSVYSRNIVFANAIGIYVSLGGAVTKVSIPLDGFYESYSEIVNLSDASCAVAAIFGNIVYMLLLPVIDQVTGLLTKKLLMWDAGEQEAPSRWFTSSQDRTLTYIATQEINSVLVAWGTDGTNVFPLFQTPSTGFTKTFQSKLYSNPAYWMTKTASELFGVIQNAGAPMTVTVDNELGPGSGGGSVSVLASSNEFNVFGPIPCGQNGSLIGLTVSTTAANATVMSLTIVEQDEATRV